MNDYTVFLVLMRTPTAADSMADDLARELDISKQAASTALSNFLTENADKFQKVRGVFYTGSTPTAARVEEILEFADRNDWEPLLHELEAWTSSSDSHKHLAIFGIVYAVILHALTPLGYSLHCCVLEDAEKPSENVAQEGSRTVAKGWVRERYELYPLVSCIPFGRDYVVWRLYPERTCVPILGFWDFARNQQVDSYITNWLERNETLGIAKIMKEVAWIELVARVRGCAFV